MSYVRHHVIVVTSWQTESIVAARAKAVELGCQVSEIITGTVNNYRSFLVGPDGSKEGWPDSAEGDARRAALVAWLRSQAYDDGSSSLEWVEVAYGNDGPEPEIVSDLLGAAHSTVEDEIGAWHP